MKLVCYLVFCFFFMLRRLGTQQWVSGRICEVIVNVVHVCNTFVFVQPSHVWSLNLGVGSLEGLYKKQLWPFSQDLESPSTAAWHTVQTHVHTGTHNILPHSVFPALLRLLDLLSTNFYLPFPPVPQIQLIYTLLIHTTFWNFLFPWINHVLIVLSLVVFLFFFLWWSI